MESNNISAIIFRTKYKEVGDNYPMQPIHDGIYFVEAPDKARPPHCHCLYIDDEVRAVIDTSCGLEKAKELSEKGIDLVLNTHFHEDHVMHNNLFKNAQVCIHAADAPALASLEGYLDYCGYLKPEDKQLAYEMSFWFAFVPSPVHRTFSNGEILDFGKVKLQVVHLPGHSPGHCGFYQEKTGMLFSGDIDLSRIGPWYGLGSCDINDFIASIETCIDIKPQQLITSHRGIFERNESNIEKLLKDYLQIIYKRESNIFEALKRPQTLEQLASSWLFSFSQPPYQYDYAFFFERMAIHKHLANLLKDGSVKQEGEIYYR